MITQVDKFFDRAVTHPTEKVFNMTKNTLFQKYFHTFKIEK